MSFLLSRRPAGTPHSFLCASPLRCSSSQSPFPSNAQQPSSSSSSSTPENPTRHATETAARVAQPEAGGSAITLETSEPLFYIAVALNTCGYDADLAASSPVRRKDSRRDQRRSRRLRRSPHQPRRSLHLHPRPHPGRQRSQPRPIHLAGPLSLAAARADARPSTRPNSLPTPPRSSTSFRSSEPSPTTSISTPSGSNIVLSTKTSPPACTVRSRR